MSKLLIITPVKDSIELTELTIRSVMKASFGVECEYVVYDDFSIPENALLLDSLAKELGFRVIHLCDIIDSPSPNYRFVLQHAQEWALKTDSHLVIVESDVVVNTDTFTRLVSAVTDNVGMVASVTIDESGNINFPYLYARKWSMTDRVISRRLSFCCTLLTNVFLHSYDFQLLNPKKNWYDVFITHISLRKGFRNMLLMTDAVVHRPHSSRPWKLLKYTNPIKYYWLKYTRGFDKI